MFVQIDNQLINSDCIKNVWYSRINALMHQIIVTYKDGSRYDFVFSSYDEVEKTFNNVVDALCKNNGDDENV